MNSPRLDPTFLTLHPATALWWEQRKQCERCKHVDARSDTNKQSVGQTVLRCKLFPTQDKVTGLLRGAQALGYCIDARMKNNPCGPDARLFKEKTE